MSQQPGVRVSMANRLSIALVIGICAGIGATFAMNSVGLGIVMGIAVFLIFGLEFS